MSANPHANGGLLLHDLNLPDFRRYGVTVERLASHRSSRRGCWEASSGMSSGRTPPRSGSSVRMRQSRTGYPGVRGDESVLGSRNGAGDEFWCQRAGSWRCSASISARGGGGVSPDRTPWVFQCYEAFIQIVDSMLTSTQSGSRPRRRSHGDGRSPLSISAIQSRLAAGPRWLFHEDPGFIDDLANKKPSIVRVYLPPDANTLLSVADHCLRSRDYVNLIVAGKQPALTYLTMNEAVDHCTRGLGIFDWASNDDGDLPDVVLGLRATSPRLRPSPPWPFFAGRFPSSRFGRQCGRPDANVP